MEFLARTFKPRRRRLGTARADVYERLMPRFGLAENGETFDPRATFASASLLCLEIGCGNGDLASHVTRSRPDWAVVAVDVHRPGIARLLADIDEFSLSNLRVVEGDALVFVERVVGETFDEVWAFFPDPWPKNAQAHRRLVTSERVTRLVRVLRPGGILRLATDSATYAQQMERVLGNHHLLTDVGHERPPWRIETRFERDGRQAGRTSVDLSARRA